MTLRDQIGQLFMVGVNGTELSQERISWLREYRPGGVILFSRNLVDPSQIATLTNSLQEHTSCGSLFIAIDQEGGCVSRLPSGFTLFPSAARIGACGSATLTYQAATITATELRAVGINMNMAPVLDIHTNPSNPIIGDRAFGTTVDQVCEMGMATIAGFQDHRMIACGKHFPGHGETMSDSHQELPTVDLPENRLKQVECQPFHQAIRHGLAAIMTAHVLYPALDQTMPATLSSRILTTLLRQEMGFTGPIISDDLEMNAMTNHWTIGDAAIQSLQAGADLLLICHQQDRQTEAMEAVQKAVEQGFLSKDRMASSLARLSHLKKRFLVPYQPIEVKTVHKHLRIQSHLSVLQKIDSTFHES